MSDPVTNVEIEDVLSSIRRLVSENARSEARAVVRRPERDAEESETAEDAAPRQESGDAKGGAGDAAGMLLLTPEQLVPVAEDADDATPADMLRQPEILPEESHHWADDGAETVVEEAAEMAEIADLSENDTGRTLKGIVADAVDEATADIFGEADAAEDEAGVEEAGFLAADEADAEKAEEDAEEEEATEALFTALKFSHSEPEPEDDRDEAGSTSLASRIAELEDAVAARDDHWDPDGDGEGENAGAPVEALNWEDDVSDQTGHSHAWGADRLDAMKKSDSLSTAEPAEAGAALTEEKVAPETDGARGVETADQSQLDIAAEPVDETAGGEASVANVTFAQDLGPDEFDLLTDQASVIDEDALRELVAEIVRRELQGVLGERITRNVRKLVRREIHRALAAREFD
ncbi:hypothetical protein [Marimonas arenosa]|uniref:Uncharacterized protein n=1 Tax=Marimonas arenosa TaxID=1795305 RepID=A0AAE3WGQ0_9RHOB|nr:hypothetical protein [Marimonas arenosa]MDQ2092334.1 hypothetical protein [Marimonas arenosa]